MKFHHMGLVSRNFQKDVDSLLQLGYSIDGEEFSDEAQGIHGVFLVSNGAPRIEVLENLPGSSTLTNLQKKGIKFYHMAYEVCNLEISLKNLIDNGAIIVSPIKNAVYFKRVVFVMLKSSIIIELVETL